MNELPAVSPPAPADRTAHWEAAAHAAGREVDRNALAAYMAVADAEQAHWAAYETRLREQHDLDVAELNRLRRELSASERTRANADFHLGQEMSRRQLAEKEISRLRAVVARLRQMTDYWEQQLPDVIRTPAVVSAIRAALEGADDVSRMADEAPAVDLAAAQDPTPLRWGLGDVLWGDDDTVTVLLSGPAGEPYWLELDPERAAVLREDLAGPDGAVVVDRAALIREVIDRLETRARQAPAPGARLHSFRDVARVLVAELHDMAGEARDERETQAAEVVAAMHVPCSFPPCDTGPGEPCDTHERLWAHAEGDHELCGPEYPAVVAQQPEAAEGAQQ